MKFVVDAQLPRRLARELAAAGHEVTHTFWIFSSETARRMERLRRWASGKAGWS
jgi:predicted nuclease of predicted toxin-antitoxin system